jgi:glycine/D-amino acid oxidase-like deaminating enzyme
MPVDFCDVVMISAGVTGMSIARELSSHRFRAVLLEKGEESALGSPGQIAMWFIRECGKQPHSSKGKLGMSPCNLQGSRAVNGVVYERTMTCHSTYLV